MKSKLSQTIIRTIANKYKLSHQQVEDIIKSPFEFQHDVMTNQCNKELMIFPTTRIRGFGIFAITDNKKKKLYALKQKNGIINTEQEDVGSGDQSRSNTD